MPLSDIHACRGKRCAYVLRCSGGSRWPFTIYCGSTTDVEVRILENRHGELTMFWVSDMSIIPECVRHKIRMLTASTDEPGNNQEAAEFERHSSHSRKLPGEIAGM